MKAIIKKELSNYFKTPLGYIFMASYLVINAVFFITFFYQMSTGGWQGDMQNILGNMMVFASFIIPIVTMRLYSEERKQGTEQLLLTSQNSVTKIVIAKFLAASILYLITIAISLLFVLIGFLMIEKNFNYDEMFSSYLGYILFSLCYIAMGSVFSALTENQIVAYVMTAALSVGFYFLRELDFISPIRRTNLFFSGGIPLLEIIYFVLFIVVCLIINIVIIENRRWSK